MCTIMFTPEIAFIRHITIRNVNEREPMIDEAKNWLFSVMLIA